jgi:hypothetical protein
MKDEALKLALEALEYNAETGKLYWRVSRGTKKAGSEAGAVDSRGYVCIMLNGKNCKAHRLAWLVYYKVFPEKDIDHINGIKTDNRICNLREVTVRQNQYNQRKPRMDNKSGYLGVSVYKNRWMASIRINGKTKHLGYFAIPEQASEAYLAAKRKFHETCTI